MPKPKPNRKTTTNPKPTAGDRPEFPNAATRETMRAADAGQVTRYPDAAAAALFEELGL